MRWWTASKARGGVSDAAIQASERKWFRRETVRPSLERDGAKGIFKRAGWERGARVWEATEPSALPTWHWVRQKSKLRKMRLGMRGVDGN